MEVPVIPGKLATANTPDHWQDVMFPHFHLWEDTTPDARIWRSLEIVVQRNAAME